MGTYWLAVNLDKREFLDPSNFGFGLKFREQVGFGLSVSDALALLISVPQEGEPRDVAYGRWAGDRVVFVSDSNNVCRIPGNASSQI